MSENTYDAAAQWEKFIPGSVQNTFPAQGLIRIFRGKYPMLPQMPKKGNLLDVGCGDARNMAFLSQEGLDCTGVEISTKIVNALKNAYPDLSFSVGLNHSLPFEENFFDLVLSWHACYYLGDSGIEMTDVFGEFFRVINKTSNSKLVLAIPMPTNFIYRNSIIERHSDGIDYVQISEDPFNQRVGERMAMFKTRASLELNLANSGWTNIVVSEEMGDWFGLQYDWWVVIAEPRAL